MTTKKGHGFKIRLFYARRHEFLRDVVLLLLPLLFPCKSGSASTVNTTSLWPGRLVLFTSSPRGRPGGSRNGAAISTRSSSVSSVMILALSVGSQLNSAAGLNAGHRSAHRWMCFLWPTIEALVSEGEDATGLPRAVGTYNVVWASTNALGLLGGGTLVEKFGFRTIFFLPIGDFNHPTRLDFAAGKTRERRRSRRRQRTRTSTNSRPAPAFARQNQGVSPHGVAREPVRLHCHQHIHPHAANRGGALSPLAHVRGICMFVVVFFVRLGAFIALWHWRTGITGFGWLVNGVWCAHRFVRCDSFVPSLGSAARVANFSSVPRSG